MTAAVLAAWVLAAPACAPPSHDALEELLASHRPFVARLSIGGPHRECEAQPPHCDPPLRTGSESFAALAALGARLGSAPQTPQVLHRRGVAMLLAGGESEAIGMLERARAAAPDDAGIVCDLAVARWVRAAQEDDLRMRLAALDLLDRGLELDPGSVAIVFNRALVLGSIPPLREEASAAWRLAEAAEEEAAWTREAALHRQRLEQPTGREMWERLEASLEATLESGTTFDTTRIPNRFSQQVRLWLEDRLLPAWGAAVEAGEEASAARRLALGRELAVIPERRGGGRTLRRTLDQLAMASQEAASRPAVARPAGWLELARAHRLYGEAREAHERQAYLEAAAPFKQAEALFERHQSPFAVWPRFYLAMGEAYGEPPNLGAALRQLRALQGDAPEDPVLGGYVEWASAYVLGYQRELAASLGATLSAAGHFARAQEGENAAAMHSEEAVRLSRLGRTEAAWSRHGEAVAHFDALVKSRRRQGAMTAIVMQLQEDGEERLALHFLEAWVREAERSRSGMSRALAYSARARGRARIERHAEALTDLRRAVEACADIPDAGARTLTRFDLAVEEAAVLRAGGDREAAHATLQAALGFIERSRAPLKLVDVLRSKAAIERDQGRPEAALASLAEAEAEIFRLHPELDDAWQRMAYLDRLRVVMEDVVAVLVEQGRGAEAFAAAERMRAPELTAALQLLAREQGVMVPREAELPWVEGAAPDAAVISYLVLADRLVVWTLADGRLEVATHAVSRAALEAEVAAVTAGLRSAVESSYRPGAAAARLARQLLPEELLDGRRSLLVVPDGPLHALPFAALPDPADDRRLLVERLALSFSTSTTVSRLLAHLDRPSPPSPVSSALVVDVPEWDRRAFPELASLRSGVTAASLRGRFPRLTLLAGPDATAAALLREYPRHAFVYFAGHSLASTAESSRAGLVLAPAGKGDDGLLEPQEVVFAAAPDTRLLVLGSCSGAGGRLSPTEGALSLVRPFLAAGTPAVIASLGPVEDAAAHALFEALVEGMDASGDPAELLRRAQVRLWRQRPEAATGALLFQLYGSTNGVFGHRGATH